MAAPLFDVIVPIHGITPDLLHTCLQSIADQTYSNFKVWVVESRPCANAVSEEITHSYGEDFQYQVQTRKGLPQARNQAVEATTAPYVAFLDGDDAWLPKHLELIADEISISDDDYVAWWGDYLLAAPVKSKMNGKEYNSFIKCGDHSEYHLFRPQDWYYFQLPLAIYPSSLVVCRKAYEAIDGFDESWLLNEDSIFLNTISQIGKGQYVEGSGCIGTTSVAETKIAEYEEVKMGFYNRLQELTIWPTLENKPPEVSDDYWDFVIDFVHSRWKQPYSLEGIE